MLQSGQERMKWGCGDGQDLEPCLLTWRGWAGPDLCPSFLEGTCPMSPQGFPRHTMETRDCKAPGGSAWTAMGLGHSLLTGLLSRVVTECLRTPAPPLPSEARPCCWRVPYRRPSAGPSARPP